jgi:CRISPR/Cas system-associated protein Cas7 (RAMP superfamily)
MKPQKGAKVAKGTKRLANVLVALLLFSGSVTAQSLDDRVKPIVATFKGKVSLF